MAAMDGVWCKINWNSKFQKIFFFLSLFTKLFYKHKRNDFLKFRILKVKLAILQLKFGILNSNFRILKLKFQKISQTRHCLYIYYFFYLLNEHTYRPAAVKYFPPRIHLRHCWLLCLICCTLRYFVGRIFLTWTTDKHINE